jgi:hypothetical protein
MICMVAVLTVALFGIALTIETASRITRADAYTRVVMVVVGSVVFFALAAVVLR